MSSSRRWLAPAEDKPILHLLQKSVQKAKIRLLLAQKFYFHTREKELSYIREMQTRPTCARADVVFKELVSISRKQHNLQLEVEEATYHLNGELSKLTYEKCDIRKTRMRATTVANAQSCAAVERFFEAMGGHQVYIDFVRPWCLRAIRRPIMREPRFKGSWRKCFDCNRTFIRSKSDSLWRIQGFEFTVGSGIFDVISPCIRCRYCICYDCIGVHIYDCAHKLARTVHSNEE